MQNWDLSENEKKLILLYRDLNKEGQDRVIEQAEFLVASRRYIKNH